jgi:hypothetical protein
MIDILYDPQYYIISSFGTTVLSFWRYNIIKSPTRQSEEYGRTGPEA